MNHNILKFLENYSSDTSRIDRLITSSYLTINKLEVSNNNLLKNLIIHKNDEDYKVLTEFCKLLFKYENKYDIESLIELFEFVVSPSDKIVNGAIYTPIYIRDYIVKESLAKTGKNLKKVLISDISCGCGAFFVSMATKLHDEHHMKFKDIYENNLYGLDITRYSVIRACIVLSILALAKGEDENFTFNIYSGDSLIFDWQTIDKVKKNKGFDIIIGNPPYVCAKNMTNETKALLTRWSVANIGNTDLYIPFFQIGYENLAANGILCYITVNSFIKSLNGRSLRDYFITNRVNLSIIDFGGEQVFKGRTTYTCICTLIKNKSSEIKYYKTQSKDLANFCEGQFHRIKFDNLNNTKGWVLSSNQVRNNIAAIEKAGLALDKISIIRNGFATLMNDLYVFTPTREDEHFYYLNYNGEEYCVERGICRNAIKPNVLKITSEINNIIEKLVFPYQITNGTLEIFDEDFFAQNFPFAYRYLSTYKDALATRDKGNKQYEKWYAFGRNQALTITGYKLFFPYIADKPYFVYSEDRDLLFYNGYAIISENIRLLKVLEKILNSSIFWYYVSNNSKPYSGNYYAFAKNHIKNFGICDLTTDEEDFLILESDQNVINDFLSKKYKIKV